MRNPNIAICYDFDGTLIRGNMQENSFLPEINISSKDFWKRVKSEARQHDMDEVLAYMQLMIEGAKSAEKKFTREALINHGRKLNLFPGVDSWFGEINQYCKNKGASVEHFVISSGLQEMIEGSCIAKEFKHIFASGFRFDANDVPNFAARSVNYTAKTQYLFRINKGILNSWDNATLNQFTPEEERPRPFSRMIYIGDGETDIPAMKMINYQGGYSVVVYPPQQRGRRRNNAEMQRELTAERMKAENRAQFVAPASYEKDGRVFRIVTMLIRRMVDEYRMDMNLSAR